MSTEEVIQDLVGPTLGERRVRCDFNPMADSLVEQIKLETAGLINLLDELKPEGVEEPEVRRLIDLAQTTYEEAAMWAVKAVTA